jgi:hypothetical protein
MIDLKYGVNNKFFCLFFTFISSLNVLMSAVNLKFIHANILRAGELHIPVNVLFGGNLAKTIESWEPTLRMEGIASVIALFNIISTTLQFSSVCRTADGRFHVPLNLFNMVIARSCMIVLICCGNENFYLFI